ncbi:hypothetical protein Catovirus_1_961 [Catovirus CTV1]|uniref:Uncharacterized protein n=1 Tax=Catovirus CTV1 TaxID=1977631 RepID=A0A1V0SB51_9VIRU|nr:hypothetical protein Catovirus_1_961 [Catovirus CTV1]
MNKSVKYTVLILLIILIVWLYLILKSCDIDKLKYMIIKTVKLLPLTEEGKGNLISTICNYFMKKTGKLLNIIPSEEKVLENIKISDKINPWDNKIKYCDIKKGRINNIYYDQTIAPTKSSFILY